MSSLGYRMGRILRAELQGVSAITMPSRAGLVPLDMMENPYGLPEDLQQALGERLGRVALNRYPGERVDVLRDALARHIGMPQDCALLLGNGSDELIRLLCLAVAVPGATVLAPEPGFMMYWLSARLHGLRYVGVSLTADFELDEAAMLKAIEACQPAIVWLAFPNNPTANLWDDAVIERLVEAAPGLVVMDEAYEPFASRNSLARLQRHEHVLLMRTMSKLGLAGARIGVLVGRRPLIAEIDKLRPPFNVSALDAEAALFALEHVDEYARQAAAVRAERQRLLALLGAVPAVTAYPSEANMIVVRVPGATRVHAGMKSRGVLVKNLDGTHPTLADCLRLTVGTPQENALMMQALLSSL